MAAYFDYYTDNAGEHRWRLKAGNHEVIAICSEGYSTEAGCKTASENFHANAKDCPLTEVTEDGTGRGPEFEFYLDKGGNWRWRYQAANNRYMAKSEESFPAKENVVRSLETLQRNLTEM